MRLPNKKGKRVLLRILETEARHARPSKEHSCSTANRTWWLSSPCTRKVDQLTIAGFYKNLQNSETTYSAANRTQADDGQE